MSHNEATPSTIIPIEIIATVIKNITFTRGEQGTYITVILKNDHTCQSHLTTPYDEVLKDEWLKIAGEIISQCPNNHVFLYSDEIQ